MSSTQSFNTVHQAQATAEDDEEQVPSEDEANEQAGLELHRHISNISTPGVLNVLERFEQMVTRWILPE
jgi:hypothetical protein